MAYLPTLEPPDIATKPASPTSADMNQGLDVVDQRFDLVHQRFDGIDSRFEAIDHRLDGLFLIQVARLLGIIAGMVGLVILGP